MIALVDADILVYRICGVCQDKTEKQAIEAMDSFVHGLMLYDLPEVYDFQFYLTGKGNFRHEKATTLPYKGNRKSEKPAYYQLMRDHLQSYWDAQVINKMEADDALAIEQLRLTQNMSKPDESVIVTLDKDLDQVEGWHCNFVKRSLYYVQPEEALFKFYQQFLVGDRVDNIQGVVGVGPKKSEKMLNEAADGLTSLKDIEKAYWSLVVEQLGLERAIENGHLLYMLRSYGDSFEKYLKRQDLAKYIYFNKPSRRYDIRVQLNGELHSRYADTFAQAVHKRDALAKELGIEDNL